MLQICKNRFEDKKMKRYVENIKIEKGQRSEKRMEKKKVREGWKRKKKDKEGGGKREKKKEEEKEKREERSVER